jgi:hypothetical protein
MSAPKDWTLQEEIDACIAACEKLKPYLPPGYIGIIVKKSVHIIDPSYGYSDIVQRPGSPGLDRDIVFEQAGQICDCCHHPKKERQ